MYSWLRRIQDATEILGVTRPRGAVVKCFHFLFFQEGKGESEQIGLGLANVWGTGAAPSFLVPGPDMIGASVSCPSV